MGCHPRFTSVEGAAESTTLAGHSIDLVTAGQAFHWFDPSRTRREFDRVLRGPGWVALIWNRSPGGISPILDGYRDILSAYSKEHGRVSVKHETSAVGMDTLFGSGDTVGSLCRMNNCSTRNQETFDAFAVDGILHFPYETQIFAGQIRTPAS